MKLYIRLPRAAPRLWNYTRNRTELFLVGILTLVAVLVFYQSIDYNFGRFDNFGAFRYDSGNMVQVVWNTLEGRFLAFTDYDGENVNRFAHHADPTILLTIPFYLAYQSPKALMLAQSVFITLSVIPLYLITKMVLKNFYAAFFVSLAFLFNPMVGFLYGTDFHAVTIAIAFALFAFYFFLKQKYVLYFMFFVLAIMSKEHVFLSFFTLGMVQIFYFKQIKVGLATAFISLFWGGLALFYLIPAARTDSTPHQAFDAAYGYLGSGYGDIVLNALKDPAGFAQIFFEEYKINYVHSVLRQFFYAPLVFPVLFLPALPELLLNTYSDIHNMRTLYYQYNAVIVPFAFLGFIYALAKLNSVCKIKGFVLVLTILLAAVNLYLSVDHKTPILRGDSIYQAIVRLARADSVEEKKDYVEPFYTRFTRAPSDVVSMIPEHSGTVSAPNFMGAHLSEREYIALYPVKYSEFDHIVAEVYYTTLPLEVFNVYFGKNIYLNNRVYIRELLDSNEYNLVYHLNGVAYFTRTSNNRVNVIEEGGFAGEYIRLSPNTLIGRARVEKLDSAYALYIYLNIEDNINQQIMYTLKTSQGEHQVLDLNIYAENNYTGEYVSRVLVPDLVFGEEPSIELLVSEHFTDDGLRLTVSESVLQMGEVPILR